MSNSPLVRKLFAVVSSIAMAVSALAFSAVPASAAAHSVGQNVNASGTIWMILTGSSGTCRAAYTSAGAFLSYGFNSFSGVVDANADDLALPQCNPNFITPAPGTIIFSDRGADKGTGYFMALNGSGGVQKRGFTSASVFTGLGFAFSNGSFADVSWMGSGSNLDNASMQHPAGSLVNKSGTILFVGNSGLIGIPDIPTFNSWGMSFKNTVPANAADNSLVMTGILGTRQPGQLVPSSTTSVTPPPTGSGLNVSLASDTPAAGTHASLSAYNNALKVNFAVASGSVNVTAITITRGGITTDSMIGGVAAFNAAGLRLTNNFNTFADSKAVLTLATPLVVSAGSVSSVWIKTNIASTGTAGTYFLSVASAGDVAASSPASGTFPVMGNTFTLVSGSSTVGAVTLDAVLVHNNGTNDATAVNINLGTTNQQLAKFRFVANSNEDVNIKSITMYNNGNTNDADIQNIKLLAPDGSTLATVAQASGRYVTFLLATPYKIAKGNTRDFSVNVDVVNGSTRNFRLVVQNDYDVEVMGVSTGSGILVTAATTVDGAFPVGDSSGGGANCAAGVNCINKITVNSGTALFSKASDAPSGNIAAGGNSIVLGKWEFTPQGENMEVRQVAYTLTYGTALTGTFRIKLNDTTIYSVAGGSTAASGVASGSLTASTYVTIPAGTKAIFTAVGDVNSTTASGQTFLVALDVPQVKRVSTGDIVDPSVTNTSANTLTVSTAALSVAKNTSFPDTTVVAGLSNAKVGSFNFTASSTEDVTVSSITVGLTNTTNVSNLTLKNGAIQLGSVTTSPAASNVVGMQFNVARGTTAAVDVYATTNGSTTGTEVASVTGASATGKDSSATVTATGLTATGQTITFSTGGTLTLALDTTNTPVAALAHSGEIDRMLLATRITSNNAEAIKVQTVQVSSVNGTASLKDLKLFVNGVQVGTTTQLNNSVASFTATDSTVGLFTVAQDTTVTLTVKGSTTTSSTLNSQAVANLSLDYVEAIGASGGTRIKPGTTLATTWSATSITAAGASITVADTTGFHRGDVVFAYDGTNGGTLGIVTAEPTSTTAMTVSGLSALTFAGSATINKLETGATTAASAGTSGVATANVQYTVTGTKGFTVNDSVIINGATTSQLGIVISVDSATLITIRALSATATGTAANISKIGSDTLGTTGATISAAQAPTATTVGSTTGFNVGDMVLFSDIAGGNAGTFCIVTAIGSATSMTLGCNAAVTGTAGTQLISRVGSANPATTLVTTAASAGNRVIAATATTVTDTTGFGAADVTLGIAATGGAILGKVGAITSATAMTIASAAASATATTRLTRLPGAAAAGNMLTFHDVEPAISLTSGFVGGAATGTTGQDVGKFDVKADGDRNMNITSVNVQANGSNLPWNYVTAYDLYNGATLLSSAVPLNSATTVSTAAVVLTGTTIRLCTADVTGAGEIRLANAAAVTAAAAHISINDTIVLFVNTTNYITAKVTNKVTASSCSVGAAATDVTLTVSNSSTTGTAPLGTTITALKSFNVYFDSAASTPLATQTVTAGSTLTLTVKADTTAVRTGLTAGTTASYNTKINGTQGTSNGGLTWGYTPSGGSAISGLTIADSYPVNGPTFTY